MPALLGMGWEMGSFVPDSLVEVPQPGEDPSSPQMIGVPCQNAAQGPGEETQWLFSTHTATPRPFFPPLSSLFGPFLDA